jgi:hypothetical protein
MSTRILPVSSFFTILFITLSAIAGSAQKATPSGLPMAVVDALDKQYPHWRLADVPSSTATCGAAADASRAVISADFDGDGWKDFAVQIVAGDTKRIIVVLTRVDKPVVWELATPVGPLVVHRQGAHFVSPAQVVDGFYTTDTLGTDVCGNGDAFKWTGTGFLKIPVTH